MPKRIQRQRTRGWTMPAGAVYVGRPTIWGNPNNAQILGHSLAVDMYRRDFVRGTLGHPGIGKPLTLEMIQRELRGKDLACWCKVCDRHKTGKPMGIACTDCHPCHADTLN